MNTLVHVDLARGFYMPRADYQCPLAVRCRRSTRCGADTWPRVGLRWL